MPVSAAIRSARSSSTSARVFPPPALRPRAPGGRRGMAPPPALTSGQQRSHEVERDPAVELAWIPRGRMRNADGSARRVDDERQPLSCRRRIETRKRTCAALGVTTRHRPSPARSRARRASRSSASIVSTHRSSRSGSTRARVTPRARGASTARRWPAPRRTASQAARGSAPRRRARDEARAPLARCGGPDCHAQTRERIQHREVEVTERLTQRDDTVHGEARQPRNRRARAATSRLRRRANRGGRRRRREAGGVVEREAGGVVDREAGGDAERGRGGAALTRAPGGRLSSPRTRRRGRYRGIDDGLVCSNGVRPPRVRVAPSRRSRSRTAAPARGREAGRRSRHARGAAPGRRPWGTAARHRPLEEDEAGGVENRSATSARRREDLRRHVERSRTEPSRSSPRRSTPRPPNVRRRAQARSRRASRRRAPCRRAARGCSTVPSPWTIPAHGPSEPLEEAARHPKHFVRRSGRPSVATFQRRAFDELGDEPRAALVVAGVMDASDVP